MFTKLPFKILVALVVIALIACYGVRGIVFNRLEAKLPGMLQELEQRNIKATITSIETSWYRNRITVNGISLSNQEPNSLPLSISEASITSITITGIELIPLLINKRITLDSVLIGKVRLSKYVATKTGKKSKVKRSFNVNYISIDSLEIVDLDSLDKTTRKTKFNFETKNLSGTIPLTELYASAVNINGLNVKLPNSNYTITTPRITLENMNHLTVDSLKVIPAYSKREFVKRAGYETDRIAGLFPSIEAEGINFASILLKNEVAIHMVKLGFGLDVYRDKRIKDRNQFKALPDSLLRKLPFAIAIDSIMISESQIRYEEFAEKADSSGQVNFKNLEATLTNISNRDPELALELIAHAQFMSDGEISVHGTFSNSDKPHRLSGSLKNFRLSRINGMLKPATGIRIESGRLELMKFAFSYNNHQSDGELSLNYHDLKLMSLRENKKDKAVPSVFKTILLNAFIQNDLDRSDPLSKRTGTIHFERDKNKFIFNFWWKSLLSGLKSASGVPGAEKRPEAAS